MRPVGHCVISHLQLLSLSARNLPISLYVVVPVFLGLPSNSYANDRVKAHSVPTDCVILSRLHVSVFSLQEIIENKPFPIEGVPHPLPLFKEYLRRGYYPFATDNLFDVKLNQIINLTMEVDIPQYANMNVTTGRKLKKLLGIIAMSVPFKPVMDKIAKMVNVSRNDLSDYFLYMENSGMIAQLRDTTNGIMGLGKIEKVYLSFLFY